MRLTVFVAVLMQLLAPLDAGAVESESRPLPAENEEPAADAEAGDNVDDKELIANLELLELLDLLENMNTLAGMEDTP